MFLVNRTHYVCSIHVFRFNMLYKTLEIDWSKLESKRIKFESTRKGDESSPYARVVTESFCDESSLLDELSHSCLVQDMQLFLI